MSQGATCRLLGLTCLAGLVPGLPGAPEQKPETVIPRTPTVSNQSIGKSIGMKNTLDSLLSMFYSAWEALQPTSEKQDGMLPSFVLYVGEYVRPVECVRA